MKDTDMLSFVFSYAAVNAPLVLPDVPPRTLVVVIVVVVAFYSWLSAKPHAHQATIRLVRAVRDLIRAR
jgi:hypothetical protein